MTEDRAWKPKMAQACVVRAELDLNQLIAIEVNKGDPVLGEFVSIPAFRNYKLCVPLVSRSFSDGDGTGPQPPEALRGGTD
jgi:hypothetical protein